MVCAACPFAHTLTAQEVEFPWCSNRTDPGVGAKNHKHLGRRLLWDGTTGRWSGKMMYGTVLLFAFAQWAILEFLVQSSFWLILCKYIGGFRDGLRTLNLTCKWWQRAVYEQLLLPLNCHERRYFILMLAYGIISAITYAWYLALRRRSP